MSDWLKKANKVLGDLAGQAGRQAEGLQLQAKLGSLDKQLDEVYIEAGKRAEELLVARQIHDDEIRVILERARVLKDEMMEVRQQIQDLRHAPEPTAEETADQAPPEPSEAPEQTEGAPGPSSGQSPGEPRAVREEAVRERACPSCGGEVVTHMVFCPHCGEKQQE